MTILVIDDHLDDLKVMLELVLPGYQLEYAGSGTEGLAKLRALKDVGCVLLDMIMPPELGEDNDGRVGLAVLKRIISERPGLPVVMHTTIDDDVELVQEALELGAYYYVAKSSSAHVLQERVRVALEQYTRVLGGPGRKARKTYARLIGKSKAACDAETLLGKYARTDETILLLGETGTGKELAARAIHHASPRRDEPFQVVDGTRLSTETGISNLWGWARGAFTGAVQDHEGAFEAADGGTVFLDEIGEVPLDQQALLLRAIQEMEVCRLGEHEFRPVDVRIIAATNRDLSQEVKDGGFREDLYYRIEGFNIELPPLRKCREDIPDLAECFRCAATPEGIELPGFSGEAAALLTRYSWPGNTRELEKKVKVAVVKADGHTITPEHFDIDFDDPGAGFPPGSPEALRAELGRLGLADFKSRKGEDCLRKILTETIRESGGIKPAGEALGLFQTGREKEDYESLRAWCKRLGIRAKDL